MTISLLLTTAFALLLSMAVFMMIGWLIEQRTGNSGWVDVVWTTGLGVTGLASATSLFALADVTGRQILVGAMISVWALRLAGHIAKRSSTVSDDPRYAKLREQWGDSAAWKMLGFLQVQAVLSVPMLIAITLAAWRPGPLGNATDFLGGAFFLIGLAGSATADWQLASFKQYDNTSGKVCDVGLWSWSRHPNYFFEWLVWVGFAVIAIDLSIVDWPWGLLAVIGPACMFWLLRFVSGVPPLEAHMEEKYGQAYEDYQSKTNAFFPAPPSPSSSRA